MVNVCVELSDLIILSGIASFGLLVFDHSNNDGKVMSQIKHFYNEVKQSVFNADEQSKCVANKATFKVDRLNDGKKKMCKDGGQKQIDVVGKDSSRFMFVTIIFDLVI